MTLKDISHSFLGNKDCVFVRIFCPKDGFMSECFRSYFDELCMSQLSRIGLFDKECNFDLDVNSWKEPVLKLYYEEEFEIEN